MKKEHLETLKKADYSELSFVIYLLNKIIDIDLASDFLIQGDEVNESLTKIGSILGELSDLSDEKEYLINAIIMKEENQRSNSKRR